MGEPVVVGLELYSRLEAPVLVSSLRDDRFLRYKVIGPDGSEVPWQGRATDRTSAYSPSEFTVLSQYTAVSSSRTISLSHGTGFAFNRPGQYTLTAEFSMRHPDDFASLATQAKPAFGSFQSSKLVFCIEACVLTPVAVRDDAPQQALDTVRSFYSIITKHPQLGLPFGQLRRAIQPLLSERLAHQLDGLRACEKDYYKRYEAILIAHTWKSATPWLEAGLFTGPNDAAIAHAYRILGSRSVGGNRVDALVGFHHDTDEMQGNATVIVEKGRWVVDDYVAMYENDRLVHLSDGYPQCKDGRWINLTLLSSE